MQKILVVHTKYKIKGGEDSNIQNEIDFLKKSFNVESLIFDNSSSLNFYDFLSFLVVSNFQANKILKNKLDSFKPDYVYIHNTWFKLGLGIFKILKKNNIKTILKIHNFRYECGSYWLLRNHLKKNSFCSACTKKQTRYTIFNKYYEDSFLKSIFLIIYSKKYYKILKNNPIKILALSSFHLNSLINIGIDEKKISLFYNPISVAQNQNLQYNSKSNYIVYAGRLTNSKGVYEMLNAWVKSDLAKLEFRIVGTGDIAENLKSEFSLKNIKFLGEIDNEKVLETINGARAVITATKMYEGQPRLLSEASMYGVPSIYPNFGSMPEFFPENYSFTFKQYDYNSLTKIINLLEDEQLLQKASKNLFSHFEKLLSEENLKNQFYKALI